MNNSFKACKWGSAAEEVNRWNSGSASPGSHNPHQPERTNDVSTPARAVTLAFNKEQMRCSILLPPREISYNTIHILVRWHQQIHGLEFGLWFTMVRDRLDHCNGWPVTSNIREYDDLFETQVGKRHTRNIFLKDVKLLQD